MKLTRFRIREFRSILDSGDVAAADLTCLVGKNEAGKTALLQALYRLNPIIPEHATFDVTDDYPRADVENYRQSVERQQRKPATVVETTYELADDDLVDAEQQFGTGVVTNRQVTLSKGYENKLLVEVSVNDRVAGIHLLQQAGLADLAADQSWATLPALYSLLEAQAEEKAQAFNKASARATAASDPEEQARLKDEAAAMAETNAAKQLRAKLKDIAAKGLDIHIWDEYLEPLWPKFLYFDEYYQMEGHLNINALKTRLSQKQLLDSDRPMLGLIELARLNLDELLSPGRTETLISRLEGASNHLSRQVLKYWSQNKHLRVRFDVRQSQPNDPEHMRSGINLWGRVDDSVHLVSTPLGSRSRGFVWFFSFLAWFSQQSQKRVPMILLLDEPGLFLHGKAQGDLLRYFDEELRPHHQVLYTTHSPFMVASSHFERVRIVEDKSMESNDEMPVEARGTKVYTNVLEVSAGSLFPLQGALGYAITQTLFIGPNSLIVEGPADLLYIQAISSVLDRASRRGLSQRWTITPVGGARRVWAFAALLGSQDGVRVAALVDIQSSDKQDIEDLYKKKLLQKRNVLTFGDFVQRPEADIEDMFSPDFYINIVNLEYARDLEQPLRLDGFGSRPQRILKFIDKRLEAAPLKNGARFNHYRPARYFSTNLEELAPALDEETLARFEKAFRSLNDLIE